MNWFQQNCWIFRRSLLTSGWSTWRYSVSINNVSSACRNTMNTCRLKFWSRFWYRVFSCWLFICYCFLLFRRRQFTFIRAAADVIHHAALLCLIEWLMCHIHTACDTCKGSGKDAPAIYENKHIGPNRLLAIWTRLGRRVEGAGPPKSKYSRWRVQSPGRLCIKLLS